MKVILIYCLEILFRPIGTNELSLLDVENIVLVALPMAKMWNHQRHLASNDLLMFRFMLHDQRQPSLSRVQSEVRKTPSNPRRCRWATGANQSS